MRYERTHEEIHDKFEAMLSEKTKLEKELQQQRNLLEQERASRHVAADQLDQLQSDLIFSLSLIRRANLDRYDQLTHDFGKLKGQEAFQQQELVDLEETIATFEQVSLAARRRNENVRFPSL